MWASLLAAIAAIPKLISSIESLLAYFNKAEQAGWFTDLHSTITDLKTADTDEARLEAAKKIQEAIKELE